MPRRRDARSLWESELETGPRDGASYLNRKREANPAYTGGPAIQRRNVRKKLLENREGFSGGVACRAFSSTLRQSVLPHMSRFGRPYLASALSNSLTLQFGKADNVVRVCSRGGGGGGIQQVGQCWRVNSV